jgi:hypothetical protein
MVLGGTIVHGASRSTEAKMCMIAGLTMRGSSGIGTHPADEVDRVGSVDRGLVT